MALVRVQAVSVPLRVVSAPLMVAAKAVLVRGREVSPPTKLLPSFPAGRVKSKLSMGSRAVSGAQVLLSGQPVGPERGPGRGPGRALERGLLGWLGQEGEGCWAFPQPEGRGRGRSARLPLWTPERMVCHPGGKVR